MKKTTVKNNETLCTVNGLLSHLADMMLSLEKQDLTIDEAKAQANLVKQSNNLLRYELDRQKFIGS